MPSSTSSPCGFAADPGGGAGCATRRRSPGRRPPTCCGPSRAAAWRSCASTTRPTGRAASGSWTRSGSASGPPREVPPGGSSLARAVRESPPEQGAARRRPGAGDGSLVQREEGGGWTAGRTGEDPPRLRDSAAAPRMPLIRLGSESPELLLEPRGRVAGLTETVRLLGIKHQRAPVVQHDGLFETRKDEGRRRPGPAAALTDVTQRLTARALVILRRETRARSTTWRR